MLDSANEALTEWFSGPGNGYSYSCPCGVTTPISTSQAGSQLNCDCGKSVKVPSLSVLRTLSGKDSYEAGVVDEIKRMIRSGCLPSVEKCLLSKQATEDVVTANILIPRFFKDQASDDWKIAMIFGWTAVLLLNIFRKPAFEEEGSFAIKVPVRASASQQPKLRTLSQHRLRKLMQIEPLYARLLKENPNSQITILERWDVANSAEWTYNSTFGLQPGAKRRSEEAGFKVMDEE